MFRTTRLLGVLPFCSILLSPADAIAAKECWADFFDKPNFEGQHVRLEGPAELPSLGKLQGQDWNNRIESLKVGPDAELIAYRRPNFEETPEAPLNHPQSFTGRDPSEIAAYQDLEISFGPNAREQHLGELKFHRNINSVKLRCRP